MTRCGLGAEQYSSCMQNILAHADPSAANYAFSLPDESRIQSSACCLSRSDVVMPRDSGRHCEEPAGRRSNPAFAGAKGALAMTIERKVRAQFNDRASPFLD